MKPPAPLPIEPPFLSFYTPTFRRPTKLARCLASVAGQTAVADIEQIVLPDHLGLGIAHGLYTRMRWIAPALRGQYVHVLCDDDALAGPKVVEQVHAFADKKEWPDVIIVQADKNGLVLPLDPPGLPPVSGRVDLCSYIVRRDIWLKHVADYGMRYEGDFDHVQAMYSAGRRFEYLPLLFVRGDALNGRPEVE